MKTPFYSLLVAAVASLTLANCDRPKTLSERAEDAANQAKAQNDPATYAAIEEAKRIAAETGRPVQIKTTQRVDVIQPEVVTPSAPVIIVEPVEAERTPGERIDNALQKAGRSLQKLGEKIEDRADR